MKNHFYLSVVLLFFFTASASAQTTWQELGPDNVGANVSSLIVDNRDPTGNTLYAGTQGGGVWKSTSAGNWWEPLGCTDNMYVSTIVQANDGKIYFGTGFNLMGYAGTSSFDSEVSGNGLYAIGQSDVINQLSGAIYSTIQRHWVQTNKLAVNPLNSSEIVAATDGGLYMSTNGGITFDTISVVGLTKDRAVDVVWSKDGQKLYASLGVSSNPQFVKSTNGGANWSLTTPANTPSFPVFKGRISIAISKSNADIIYLYAANSFGQVDRIVRSFDGGNTWTNFFINTSANNLLPSYEAWRFMAIAIHPSNNNQIIVGSSDAFTLDSTNGVTLQDQYSPYYDYSGYTDQFVFDEINGVLYKCGLGGLHKSYSISEYPKFTFHRKDFGIKAAGFYDVAATRQGKVLGGSHHGNGVYRSDLFSKSFDYLTMFQSANFVGVSKFNDDFIFSSDYFGKLYVSYKGGDTSGTAFDLNIDPQKYEEPSVCGGQNYQNAPFIAPFVLKETKNADNNRELVNFVADKTYNADDTIICTSNTSNVPFKTTTSVTLNQGDILPVPDQVVSRLFLSTNCGVWMKAHALDTTRSRDWFRVMNTAGLSNWFETSNNMDTLYVSTTQGFVNKVVGLNSVDYQDSLDKYKTDSLTISQSLVKQGYSIEGLAIDRQNNQVLICGLAGSIPSTDASVYKSIDGGATWQSLLNGPMGVAAYTCLIDENNSNTYLVGTQNGLWVSYDAGQTWQHEVSELCQIPVFRLRQTPLLVDECPVVYAATSRGLWRSFSLTPNGCNTSVGMTPITTEGTDLVVYPNPTAGQLYLKSIMQNAGEAAIQITDISGRLIMQTKMDYVTGEQIFKLDISAFASGMYFATLVTNDRRSTKMFVVE
jgi:hypothetical protein